ncbi:transglycosylase SLT domain-containing protein [Vibrio sp.]|uniref:Lytic murein transglycosylase n=1 Tax=Vibrio viridaestus TaxID=2487322 RepID=A0A3N9TFP8_9VIBR|nr:transglycosylase SLT domain-containing protein [Vibrio viridaestus]MDC0612292.1 transglycosylase SLT domain-containing protein [Vibrio sp.]RQW63077.1 lytic murein transglycosylase [Vibrio viridaestus]
MAFWSSRVIPLAGAALSVGLYSFSVLGAPLTLKEQRDLYDQAQTWLDRNQVEKYYQVKDKLSSYPLSPYLDYRAMLVNLDQKPPIVVRSFIDSHEEFPFSGRISAPYLRALANDKKWSVILSFQKDEPKGEEFQCYYYTAMYHAGKKSDALKGAQKLWLQGHSVSSTCDNLFGYWEKHNKISDDLIIERMLLSFDSDEYALMKYLSGKVSTEPNREFARAIMAAYQSPKSVIKDFTQGKSDQPHRRLIELSLNKLARRDVSSAYALLNDFSHSLDTSDKQVQDFLLELQKDVASRLLYKADNESLKPLAKWRDSVIERSHDDALIERRVRLAIKFGDWQEINYWINQFGPEELNSSRWQFWKAQSEIQMGDGTAGKERLKSIVNERSFYSAAAATVLDQLPDFPAQPAAAKLASIDRFKTSLNRIRELVLRDKSAAAKSEWYWLLSRANLAEKQSLAYYAKDAHWYHFSIIASIKGSLWDNLVLRFPIAYKNDFDRFGQKYNIDPVTLMSLARQESAMDRTAQSPVGARGLMQLMPDTAKYAARKYQLEYRQRSDLYDPEKNIELGTRYLDELLEKYDGNRILAFAAYNAGPRRVDYWLKQTSGQLDVYRFIESIPFKETRGYVQNILMFEIYYRKLLNTKKAFLRPVEVATKY